MLAGAVLACAALHGAAPPDELMETWLRQDGGLPKGKTEAEYRKDCLARRAKRLKGVADFSRRWAYCRHYVMGGSHYAYTEALSDAQNERTYLAIGSSLCLAEYAPDGQFNASGAYNYSPVFKVDLKSGSVTEVTDW